MDALKPWLHLGGLGIAIGVLMWALGAWREEMHAERELCRYEIKKLSEELRYWRAK